MVKNLRSGRGAGKRRLEGDPFGDPPQATSRSKLDACAVDVGELRPSAIAGALRRDVDDDRVSDARDTRLLA
jgi:hypothetical protein